MRAILALITLTVGLSGSAGAAPQRKGDDDQRWLPGIAVMMTLTDQGTDSSVTSNIRSSESPGALFSESQTLLFASIGGAVELMTPVVLDVPGKPRFFAHADVLPVFTTDRKLAFEGAPGEFSFPPELFFPEEAIEGQGSRTSIDIASLAYGAGAGVALAFEVFDIRFRVKPSVEYYRYSGTFRGIVSRAFKSDNALPPERLVQLNLTDRRTWDALGGGVEIEVDALDYDNMKGVVFISGRGYSIVGDRSIDRVVSSPAVPTPDVATFTYKAEPTLYNIGIGFRLRWTGF